MNARSLKLALGISGLAVLSFTSCKKDDPEPQPPVSTVPSTYSFDNVNYGGQTVRILLADKLMGMIDALEAGGSSAVTKAALEDVYENKGNYFSDISTGKKLSDKMFGGAGGDMDKQFRAWFDTLATRSGQFAGSEQAVTTADGIYIPEMIEKGIMGHVFYYNALKYLNDEVPVADNNTVKAGEGTKMQHNWDEAFGYFGAARNYTAYTDDEISKNPSQKDVNGDGTIDPKSERNFYFARYAGSRDKAYTVFTSTATDYTKDIFTGFAEGRDAINRKDYTKRDEAAAKIKLTWDKIIGASAIKYGIDCKTAITNGANYNGKWAELKCFVDMTQVNSTSKLNAADFARIKALYGNKPADLTAAKAEEIVGILKAAYGF